MRFLYIRLKNYIGIYNGMSLNQIEINFASAINRVTVISGKNGCGKSTLLNALTVNPDPASCFIENLTGEKEIHILDDGNVYKILITSNCSTSGTRTTKATVCRNGVELNTNGNISSYKEIVYNEFDLDPNYITLSALSSTDRGLADKSPAERKKYVSFLINAVEVYNKMNKVFSKKTTVCKSHLNSVSSKINNIGNEKLLLSTLTNLSDRFDTLTKDNAKYNKELTKAESFVAIVDPDGSIQDQYNYLYKNINECNSKLSDLNNIIITKCDKLNIKDNEVGKSIDILESKNNKLRNMVEISTNKYNTLLSNREESISSKIIKEQKLDNIKSDYDVENLDKNIEELVKVISEQESIFINSGITNFDVSSSEYIYIFKTLKKIKEDINLYKSNKSYEILTNTIQYINDIDTLTNEMKLLFECINSKKELLSEINNNIIIYKQDIETITILSERPSKCKIDSCPLINNAVNISKRNPSLLLEQSLISKDNIIDEIQSDQIRLDLYIQIKDSILDLQRIIDNINENTLINKIPISVIFTNRDEFLNRILNNNTFNEIEDGNSYISRAEYIENYIDNKNTLLKLESLKETNNNKIYIIKELKEDILNLDNSIIKINDEMNLIFKDINFNQSLILDNESNLVKLKELLLFINDRDLILNTKNDLLISYNNIKSNLDKIKIHSDNINIILDKLDDIEDELGPLNEQKKMVEHSLLLLEECKKEYEMYKDDYNIINTLQKYSNPSKDGIQNLFINIYMSKTLIIANDILKMLFGGEYKLLDYIINENEFRMPFIGTGMTVDDISSGSTSQVCMMGMIINLVLLYQASSKFNIVRLDEIMAGNDIKNRYEFVEVLYKLIEILNFEQVILIAHSLEMDMSNVDVIKFKDYDDAEDIGGNVIFDYRMVG